MVCSTCVNTVQNINNNYVCDCSYQEIPQKVIQKKTCTCPSGGSCCIHSIEDNMALQKKIWKQSRVASSLHLNNLKALTVEGPQVCVDSGVITNVPISKYSFVNWNQSSDRSTPSIQRAYRPSRGNSTKTTKTSHRPGGSGPSGTGVDIKHNSYDRYLARKKGKVFNPIKNITEVPLYGNKTQTYNIVSNT